MGRYYVGMSDEYSPDSLAHHGILGMKWGIRRFQYPDGRWTPEGKLRYSTTKTTWKDRVFGGVDAKAGDYSLLDMQDHARVYRKKNGTAARPTKEESERQSRFYSQAKSISGVDKARRRFEKLMEQSRYKKDPKLTDQENYHEAAWNFRSPVSTQQLNEAHKAYQEAVKKTIRLYAKQTEDWYRELPKEERNRYAYISEVALRTKKDDLLISAKVLDGSGNSEIITLFPRYYSPETVDFLRAVGLYVPYPKGYVNVP